MRQPQRQRRGAVLVLVTVCLVILMMMLALAIDVGTIAVARSQCQAAADVAAMAGARIITGNSTTNYNVAAAPGQAISAAISNKVLGQNVQGTLSNVTTPNGYTYNSGQVSIA